MNRTELLTQDAEYRELRTLVLQHGNTAARRAAHMYLLAPFLRSVWKRS